MQTIPTVQFIRNGEASNDELNRLWQDAYKDHVARDLRITLSRCEVFWVARLHGELVGFVKAIGDGDQHAFLLDPIVLSSFRRKGIGANLIAHLARDLTAAKYRYIHVDFTPENENFYRAAGFNPSLAGIMLLPSAQ